MIIYTYQKCSTCKKATKWLTEQGFEFEERPIRETPPTRNELETMAAHYDGNLKKLFNTSGMDYRSLGLKDKIDQLSEEKVYGMLTENGNLVKRPFLLTADKGLVGFKAPEWETLTD